MGCGCDKKTCSDTSCWIFSVIVWILLILFIFTCVKSSLLYFLYPLIVCYIIYLILEFCSPTSKYLCNISTDQGMYEQIGRLFMTPPIIKFYCECYHYRVRHYTTKSKNGQVRHHTKRVRVVTHRETFVIPYYSARDVSGLFYLNYEGAALRRKTYIKLDLFGEVNFADPISYMDYMFYKDEFWRRNRYRDVYMHFNESRIIPGLTPHNLIKFGNDHCCMNFFWFFICTIITFAEFYKILFNSFCLYQSYRVRKLVSTRYDLNQPVYQEQYLPLVPQLNLITQQYTYEANYYNYLNPKFTVKVPTAEELSQAEQYKDKIPDYHVSSGNGKFHAGVIEDDVGFSSADYNTPPPAFASVGGDVAIDQNQVNALGNVPNGFGENQNNMNQNTASQLYVKPNQNYVNANSNPNLVNPNYVSVNQKNQNQGFSSINLNQQNQNQGYSGNNLNQQNKNQGFSSSNLNQQNQNQGFSSSNLNQQNQNQGFSSSNFNQQNQNQGFSSSNFQAPPSANAQVLNFNSERRSLK